jgi:hypothetical protein
MWRYRRGCDRADPIRTLRRFEQQGITVAATVSVLAELAGDHPTYSTIMRGSKQQVQHMCVAQIS